LVDALAVPAVARGRNSASHIATITSRVAVDFSFELFILWLHEIAKKCRPQ
jgi:hypothetical protein